MRGKTFRVYQGRKDPSGLLLMSAGGFTRDTEKLYEDQIRLQTEINQLKTSNKHLQTQIQRLQASSPQHPHSTQPYEALINDLQQQLSRRDSEITLLKREIQYYKLTDIETRISLLTSEKDVLQRKLDLLTSEISSIKTRNSTLEKESREKDRKIESLSKEIVSLSDALKDANARRSAIEDELQSRSDLKKIPMLKMEIVKIRTAKDTLEGDKRRLLIALNGKNKEIEEMFREMEEGKREKKELESEVERLNKGLRERDEVIEMLKAEIEAARLRAEEAEKQLISSESEKDQLRRQVKNLNSSLSSKSSDFLTLQNRFTSTVSSLESQLASLSDSTNNEIEALKRENGILTINSMEQRKKLDEYDTVLLEVRGNLKDLMQENEEMKREIEENNRNIEKLKTEIADLNVEKEKIVKMMSDYKKTVFEAVAIFFIKITKKMRKKGKSPIEILSQFSDTSKISKKDLKSAYKSLKFPVKTSILKVSFLLLGDEEGKIPYEVLRELYEKYVVDEVLER